MTSFKTIQNKLEGFIRRYYTNELLKGAILFFAIGLLYMLFTLFIEHVLWLNTKARTMLFWLFVGVELGLLVKFICIPLSRLLKLQKGIDYEIASRIIGRHFPDVNDKLLNVLQLHNADAQSELLLASIEQKSLELKPVPFKLAISFKRNLKYLKYAAIPIFILLFTFFTGNIDWFSNSYKRVIDYKTAYEPPAPFQFFVVNEDLNGIENEDFKLVVRTAGKVTPESAQISYNNETYVLQQKTIGKFEYTFTQPREDITFQLLANDVVSKPYRFKIINTPSLLSFEMVLDYPNYTKKKDAIFKSTGNAVVPEGTEIKWKLNTKSTDYVNIYAKDTLKFEDQGDGKFEATKHVFTDYDYTLSTSNASLKNYENIGFSIDVVKDEYPEINLKVEKDSLDLQSLYFFGQISDDYGFTKLQLVYYPADDENNKKYITIPISNFNIEEFISAFPNNYQIETGIPYQVYFQVSDNDAFNNFKSARSTIFTYRKRTKEEEEEEKLKIQSQGIKELNTSLEKFEEQERKLEELTKIQKEKSNLSFNDKKKLESFLKRQKEQDDMMKKFNNKLKDNLEEFSKEDEQVDQFREDLKERLKDNEEKLEKDEKLLEEIKKLQDKINKEELTQKLDELAKQNKNKKRSLEQLLELTKRFYVEKKLEKLKEDLQKLADEQEELSKTSGVENTKKKQEELNKEFENYKEQLDELEKENKALKKPIDVPRDKLDEQEVQKEQKSAAELLNKSEEEKDPNKGEEGSKESDENFKNAQKSQKKAAQKMRKMSQEMESAMLANGGEQMEEDMDMLRQILDNLVLFSFDQEALMSQFESIEVNHNKFASYLKKQRNLREHFEHIDDSLFALSLRQPKLSEQVNKEISDVYYNIDGALDLMADNQLYQGVSKQQFAITSANNLANFLSNTLDGMQESMQMSSGKGGEGDMQLPDIIMSQEELNKMMKDGLKKGKKGDPKEGGKKDGEGNKEDESGKGKEGEKKGKNKQKEPSGQEGEGLSEGQEELLYEIYQRQQQLREALQEKLVKEGMDGKGKALVRSMESIEIELLNKGFTKETLQKMLALEHQLLKLENAVFQQGEDNKRESETNKNVFDSNSINQIPTAKEYFKSTEILNRQALPLQQVYKDKVQEYFKESND